MALAGAEHVTIRVRDDPCKGGFSMVQNAKELNLKFCTPALDHELLEALDAVLPMGREHGAFVHDGSSELSG